MKHRIEVPSYNRFRSTISSELSGFEINLTNIIKLSITQIQKDILAELTKVDSANNYQLTRLKTISHERNPSSIRDSVKDFQIVKNTYRVVLPLIKQLNLHTDTIKYFGTWIRKASNFQIQQLNESRRYLYLMCFIYSQYCFRQDFLADILLLSVRSTENRVHKSEKESSHQNNGLHSQTINQAKQGNITKTAPINFMSIKDQDQLDDEGKFRKSLYKSLLYSYSAAAFLKAEIISLKPPYRYLSLENYLYPYEKWQTDKMVLLVRQHNCQISKTYHNS